MGGQIVDASLIAAPKQRNTEEEKKAVKEGRIPEEWKAKPAKLRHKDRDARWTVKFSKAKARPDGTVPPVDIAIPTFGYQNHVSIDREHGLIRRWDATDAAAYEGARLREGLLDKTNTASAVWADTAYRSKANEAFLESNGFVSRIHRKKPPRRPMPETTRRANAVKSKVRSGVEHVFAVQKDKMDLFIRTVGIARARLKIGMANLVYSKRCFDITFSGARVAAIVGANEGSDTCRFQSVSTCRREWPLRGELRFSLARGGGEVGAPERRRRLSPRASRKAFGPAMSRVIMA